MKNNKHEIALVKSSNQAQKLNESKIKTTIQKASHMITSNKYIKDVVGVLSPFIEMLKYSMISSSAFKLMPKEMFTIIGALVYLVSPLDIIPDFLVPFGFTDDISVVMLAAQQVSSAMKRFEVYKKENPLWRRYRERLIPKIN